VKSVDKPITFRPTLAGKDYPVYAHSYLAYGADQAKNSYFEYLIAKQGSLNKTIISPCHNDGYEDTVKIEDKDCLVVGKYDGVLCKEAINNKIFCNDPNIDKCPFVYQPKLSGDFYGFSAIYFALRDVGLLKKNDEVVTLAQIKLSADTFCSKPAKDLDTSMFEVYGLCFQLNYIYELLKDGYNIDENSFILHVAKDLHGFKLNWTLGAMLKATKII
jgi:Golgi nucleoside diphosphatase